MKSDETRIDNPSVNEGRGSGLYVDDVINAPDAALSDFRLVGRALREGFPISPSTRRALVEAAEGMVSSGNWRRRAKAIQLLVTMAKLNVELIKLGHKDLHAVESDRRQRASNGILPANMPGSEPPHTKQLSIVSFESFVASLPQLKRAHDSSGLSARKQIKTNG